MNTSYIIFIIIIVYTLMYGIISFISGIIPSFLVFNKIIKNNKRYEDISSYNNSKSITIILNIENKINEFIIKVQELKKLNYDNFDIYIVNGSDNPKASKKLINKLNLTKENKTFTYKLNKEEILSEYKNKNIHFINKENGSKWNNINAVLDNIYTDLFIVMEEEIFFEENSLCELTKAFNTDDETLFSMGIIKTKKYINEKHLKYTGIKTHDFLSSMDIIKNIKNKLFLKTYNYEFCNGIEIGKNFTLYNTKKVVEVGGFNDNVINPNNDLKNRLVNTFTDKYELDYNALAFEEEKETALYLNNNKYETYINYGKNKNINSFGNIVKLYEYLTSTVNPILEIPIFIVSLILMIIKAITPQLFLCYLLIYISFDTLKNILLIITDKLSLKKNTNIIETFEVIGFCILYNFGLRQGYNLNNLFIRIHLKQKEKSYYTKNEIYGYKSNFEIIENEITYNNYTEEEPINNTKEHNQEEEKKIISEVKETDENKDYINKDEDLNEIIKELDKINIMDDFLSHQDNVDDIIENEEVQNIKDIDFDENEIKDYTNTREDITLENDSTDNNHYKDSNFEEEYAEEESELQKIIKKVEQTSNKIDELERALNKELNDINKRSKYKGINEELNSLKKEIAEQEKNIDQVSKNKESKNSNALDEIASSLEIDELDEDKIDEEFSNITI